MQNTKTIIEEVMVKNLGEDFNRLENKNEIKFVKNSFDFVNVIISNDEFNQNSIEINFNGNFEFNFEKIVTDFCTSFSKVTHNFKVVSSLNGNTKKMPKYSSGGYKKVDNLIKVINNYMTENNIDYLEDLIKSDKEVTYHKHGDLGLITFRENGSEIMRFSETNAEDIAKVFDYKSKDPQSNQLLWKVVNKYKHFVKYTFINNNTVSLESKGNDAHIIKMLSSFDDVEKTFKLQVLRDDLFGLDVINEVTFNNFVEAENYIETNELLEEEVVSEIVLKTIFESFYN